MNLKERLENQRAKWRTIRRSRGFRNILLYLVFVAIAALFWLMMALNDNIQDTVDVAFRIYNVPDSATFITDPPTQIHVSVRDKSTSLLRNGILRRPTINIDFKEYASHGVLRLAPADMYALLRGVFGSSAQITSMSTDSLRLDYTFNPGRRVPIVVRADVTPATGFVIAGALRSDYAEVTLYSNSTEADTITKVYTDRLVRRDLSSTEKVNIRLRPIQGVKMVPSTVSVTIPVETLVKKKSTVPITVVNVPAKESLLIFPANVDVTYFVPMSKFNDATTQVTVVADYNDLQGHKSRMPIHVDDHSSNAINVTLLTDSVEYTIVRE